MSENKYIIDKDSLTGIADAVRDKLGVGEAITDEDAGYYPVPGIVGVYAPSITISLNTGSTGTNTYGLKLENSQYESLYGDNSFSKIEIFGSYSDPGLSRSQVQISINQTACTMTYDSTKKTFSATYSFGSPQNFLLMRGDTKGYISPSYSSTRTFTFSAMHFILKDANDKVIPPKLENLPVTWNPYGSTATRTVVTSDMYYQDVATPIPFSIDNIQDKITNYLEKKSTIKTKLFIQRYSSSTTQAQYSKYANYLWTTSAYNYNVGPSDPTYITTKIPNLRPENIIYMAVITANNNEKKYQFRSEIYPMQHYKTLSQSGSGKRLATATDYYFFPNGCAFKSYSENYGLLAHWDKNNSILDLQGVSKSSGTIDGTITASSSAYLNPYMLYIIYEEATE